MELEIRHLRVICAIAETGSLTRAAAALRLSQPGLTAQLQRIERMLGGALFTRDVHGAVPTAFGRLVLARARAVLPALEELRVAVATPTGAAGLRLGTVAGPLVAGLLGRLRELFPDGDPTTHGESCSTPLLDLVASGHLELAVVGDCPGYEIPPRPGIVLQPVVTEPVFALLPADHPLAAKADVELADLATLHWTLPPHDDDRIREYYHAVFAEAEIEPVIAHQVEGGVVYDLVRTAGVVSLCQATCRPPIGVAVRPISRTPLWYRHVLAWHADGPLASRAEEVTAGAVAAYEEVAKLSPIYVEWRDRHEPR